MKYTFIRKKAFEQMSQITSTIWIRNLALREKGPYAPISAPKYTGDKALLSSSSLEIPDFWLEFSSIDLKCN